MEMFYAIITGINIVVFCIPACYSHVFFSSHQTARLLAKVLSDYYRGVNAVIGLAMAMCLIVMAVLFKLPSYIFYLVVTVMMIVSLIKRYRNSCE